MIVRNDVPREIAHVADTLENAGFEAYLVGGCVRDLVLGKTPKDWDITTNATPDQIEALFPETFQNNDFGTVGVVNEDTNNETLKVVEVTPYRVESTYSDARRPDAVQFSNSIDDDLKRRDFTVNAIAFRLSTETLVDHFGGREDLKEKRIRAVGDAVERFSEDAPRMLHGAQKVLIHVVCMRLVLRNTDTAEQIRRNIWQ